MTRTQRLLFVTSNGLNHLGFILQRKKCVLKDQDQAASNMLSSPAWIGYVATWPAEKSPKQHPKKHTNRSAWHAEVADRSWLDGVQCGYSQDFVENFTSTCVRRKLRSCHFEMKKLSRFWRCCKFKKALLLQVTILSSFLTISSLKNQAMKPSTNPLPILGMLRFFHQETSSFFFRNEVARKQNARFFLFSYPGDVGTSDFFVQ